MNHDADWKIDAFVDGELDLAGQLEMEQRVANDESLRARVETIRALRDAVRGKAERRRLSAELRDRLVAQAKWAAAPARRTAWRRWLTPSPALRERAGVRAAWPALAAFALGAACVLGANVALRPSARQGELMEEAVASHVRSTIGEHLVDVASSDHHAVKPYLSARLGFSPPVSELSLPGSTFLGGRVDYFGGRPVAALVYRQGQHVVNSFVWPAAEADSEPVTASARGFLVARWSQAGMRHCVISDLNPVEFQQLVAAVRRSEPLR